MTFEEYKKLPGINASLLKACHQSPFDGWHYLHNPPEPTEAMAFGSAVDAALLEPNKFDSLVAVSPKMDKRTKLGKEMAAAFETANAGKLIIDQDDFELLKTIVSNCKAIPHVSHALESFAKQTEYFWQEAGVDFKARLDLVSESIGAVIDVKTTRDASKRAFFKQLIELRYDIQMFHYAKSLGKIAPHLYIIAIENTTGQVACYDITQIVYSDFTKKRYEDALHVAIEVLKMKKCPAKFKPEVIELTLPKWCAESETV